MTCLFANGSAYALGYSMKFALIGCEEGQDTVSFTQVGALEYDGFDGVAVLLSHGEYPVRKHLAPARGATTFQWIGPRREMAPLAVPGEFNHVCLGGDERIRTAGAAFAEPCLTTWRRRHEFGRGAGDGDRTRDFLLGKEMLYH